MRLTWSSWRADRLRLHRHRLGAFPVRWTAGRRVHSRRRAARGLTPIRAGAERRRAHPACAQCRRARRSGGEGEHVEDVRNILTPRNFIPRASELSSTMAAAGDFGLAVAPGQSQQWTIDSNSETMVGCIIEEITGMNNSLGILAFPEIDMIHLGRWDLSHSMGWPDPKRSLDLEDQIISSRQQQGR